MARPRIADIVTIAAELAMTTPAEILGQSRRRRIVRVRHACFYVAHRQGNSLSEIGRRMCRDHSTVLHGCEKAEDYITRYPPFANFIARLDDLSSRAKPFVGDRL